MSVSVAVGLLRDSRGVGAAARFLSGLRCARCDSEGYSPVSELPVREPWRRRSDGEQLETVMAPARVRQSQSSGRCIVQSLCR